MTGGALGGRAPGGILVNLQTWAAATGTFDLIAGLRAIYNEARSGLRSLETRLRARAVAGAGGR